MDDPLTEQEARLVASDGEVSSARVDALLAVFDALNLRDQPRRLALALEARALAEQLGDARRRALAVGMEGLARYFLSENHEARALLCEALAFLEDGGEGEGPEANRFRGMLSLVLNSLGDYEEALALAYQTLQASRAAGDELGTAWLLQGMSAAYLDNEQPEVALAHAREALALFEALAFDRGVARARSSIASALLVLGRHDEAEPEAAASLTLFRKAGDALGEARALHDIGRLVHARGAFAAALEHHEHALALRRAVGNRQAETSSLIEVGHALTALGRPGEALGVLHEACTLAERIGVRPRVFQAHHALAEAYEATGDAPAALRHLRAYHAIREEVLGHQARARVETLEARQEAERARHAAEVAQREAEISRLRSVELVEANRRQEQALEELRETQAQLVQAEKMASLGRMVAGVAHELKNPLNFVNNFAGLSGELLDELREALTADDARPAAEALAEVDGVLDDLAQNQRKIAEHGRRADGIVQSMLRHARSGGAARVPTDLHALLDAASDLALRGSTRGAEAPPPVAVERAYGAGVPPVPVVPQEVERVFVNLVENALYAVRARAAQAGPGFTPRVRVRTERRGEAVAVWVEDNGVGIPAAAASHIFEPFFTTKPPGEGTGLGLSLAYDIVAQGHGGTMGFEPSALGGAAFVVTLPAEA